MSPMSRHVVWWPRRFGAGHFSKLSDQKQTLDRGRNGPAFLAEGSLEGVGEGPPSRLSQRCCDFCRRRDRPQDSRSHAARSRRQPLHDLRPATLEPQRSHQLADHLRLGPQNAIGGDPARDRHELRRMIVIDRETRLYRRPCSCLLYTSDAADE